MRHFCSLCVNFIERTFEMLRAQSLDYFGIRTPSDEEATVRTKPSNPRDRHVCNVRFCREKWIVPRQVSRILDSDWPGRLSQTESGTRSTALGRLVRFSKRGTSSSFWTFTSRVFLCAASSRESRSSCYRLASEHRTLAVVTIGRKRSFLISSKLKVRL
jgi:hypothetical protein